MHYTSSLRGFPSVAFENSSSVCLIDELTMAVSRPFEENR